ncbi:alpha-glucosidase [Paraliobacillus sp. JSM ZJ581]|uniref:glycoside hydrolase family 13 protein n=1 Tax=Paraliobacillus sp. JSM ZJ581 TaxID=3342118 RepID=UPI0035A85620
MKQKWWHDSVIYQIYPRSFQDSNGDGIGDLTGIISRLDYLKELGVDLVWLCPVYASPNDDNGYDISDYYEINPEYGTIADMEKLIAEAKKRGIGIMMDIVANHTSDEHPWFIEACKNEQSKYRNFYIFRDGKNGAPPSDLSSVFSGSAWEYSDEAGQYYLHLFSKKQPDLNWHNPEVRQAMYEVLRFWIKKGIKGFRFDVIDLIAKEIDRGIISNGPLLHDYVQEMYNEALKHMDVVTVGEANNADLEQALLFSGEDREELNMVFSFEHIALDEVIGKQKWDLKSLEVADLKRVFSKMQNGLAGKGWNGLFWNNHDQPRVVTRWGDDQKYRYESATMLATLLHLLQGTPYIYQGEEIGMTGIRFPSLDSYKDIETHNMYQDRIAKGYPHDEIMESIYVKGRDNSRTPMQWDCSARAGFTTAIPWIEVNPNYKKINVEVDRNAERSIYRYYQRLIQLRKNNRIIVKGEYQLLETSNDIYAYTRNLDEETWYVLCNFTDKQVNCSYLKLLEKGEVVMHNYFPPSCNQVLRPYEVMVLKVKNREGDYNGSNQM